MSDAHRTVSEDELEEKLLLCKYTSLAVLRIQDRGMFFRRQRTTPYDNSLRKVIINIITYLVALVAVPLVVWYLFV